MSFESKYLMEDDLQSDDSASAAAHILNFVPQASFATRSLSHDRTPLSSSVGRPSSPVLTNPTSFFTSRMPTDVVRHILSFLETHEFLQTLVCNKHLKQAGMHESVWRYRTQADWHLAPDSKSPELSWRDCYIHEYTEYFMPVTCLLREGSSPSLNIIGYVRDSGSNPFLHPSDDLQERLGKNASLRSAFRAQQRIAMSQEQFFHQMLVFPLLLVSWITLLVTEFFFPDFFTYPYFVVADASYGLMHCGLLLDLSIAYRFAPLYLFSMLATFALTQVDTESQMRQVFTWKVTENVLRKFLHEFEFRYVLICGLMLLIASSHFLIETFGIIMSLSGVMLSLRGMWSPFGGGNVSFSALRTDLLHLFANLLWLYFHWNYDLIWLTVDHVTLPIFHLVTFGLHRHVVYGENINLFCSSVLVLLLIEVLINVEFARRSTRTSPLSVWRLCAITICTLVNSHVMIYVVFHVGAWHVLMLKFFEELFNIVVHYLLIVSPSLRHLHQSVVHALDTLSLLHPHVE